MKMTLTEYIKIKNGVSIGSSKSLRNNLYRSFGSKNFSTFWNYWNPIFDYYLGKFIFKPLKKIFPVAISLLFTFIINGLIHDTVTTLLRGKISFFFSIWFLLMGLAVLLTRTLKHNFSKQVWIARASFNLTIVSACLVMTIYINMFLTVAF
jgi:hypothetical protein